MAGPRPGHRDGRSSCGCVGDRHDSRVTPGYDEKSVKQEPPPLQGPVPVPEQQQPGWLEPAQESAREQEQQP